MDIRRGPVAGLNNPAAVAITGGSITGATGIAYTLAKGGIPLIGLSSGSVAAGGAITGITALPLAYAAAYCWFPANILATVKAAGWYYCTFSSTTAGTAFLDTYTSGVPTIPASPTPVIDGKGAFTGDLTEEFANTVAVPANAMGANGMLRITYQAAVNNTANTKNLTLRFSGNAGTVMCLQNLTSVAGAGATVCVGNAGSTASQLGSTPSLWGVVPSTFSAKSAVDTTAGTTIVLSMTRAAATDNIVILPPIVEVLS